MKALSLTRPWTTLVLEYGKNVENRNWTTPHRGPLLVHGAKSWADDAFRWAERATVDLGYGLTGHMSMREADHPMGILGVVDVLGCCTAARVDEPCDCGPWAMPGQAHWAIANPVRLREPIRCPGARQLWTPPDDVLERVYEQIGRPAR